MTTDHEDDRDVDEVLTLLTNTYSGALSTIAGLAVGGTAGAVLAGTLAGFIPALLNSPVAKRQRKQLDSTIANIDEKLSSRLDDLEKLNEHQFKIIGESLLTLRETMEVEKIEYLKSVIFSAVDYDDFSSYETVLLSRIIRDISATEMTFLINNHSCKSIKIHSYFDLSKERSDKQKEDDMHLEKRMRDEGSLLLKPGTSEEMVANSLITMGVLVSDGPTIGLDSYKFSDISEKLIKLVSNDFAA